MRTYWALFAYWLVVVYNELLQYLLFQEIHSLGSLDETEEASHTTHHVTENDTENREKEEEEKMDEERGHFRGEDSVTTDAPITMGPTVQPSFWQQVMDPNTNHPYYWNPSTNEVLWSLPEGGVITGGGVGGLGEREDEEYFDFYKESDSSGDHSKVRSGRGGGGGRGGERKSDAGNVSSKENIAVAVVESAATTGKGKSNIPFRADSESTSATNPASQPKGTEKVESEAGGRGGGGEQKPLQDEEEMDFVGPLPAIGKASVGEGRREEGDQEEGERGILTVTQTPPSRLKRKAEERDEQEQGEEDEVVFSHLEHTYSVQAGFHADHGSVSPPKKMAHSARSFGRAPEEKLSRKSYGNCLPLLSCRILFYPIIEFLTFTSSSAISSPFLLAYVYFSFSYLIFTFLLTKLCTSHVCCVLFSIRNISAVPKLQAS